MKKAARLLRVADGIMYSGYGNKEAMGLDQVKTWTEWKQYLGEIFSLTWISSDQDSNEYRTLLKARGIWDLMQFGFMLLNRFVKVKKSATVIMKIFAKPLVEYGFMKIKS